MPLDKLVLSTTSDKRKNNYNSNVFQLWYTPIKILISQILHLCFINENKKKAAYEEEWKAKKASQMELQQVGKNQAILWAKTTFWMDLHYCITEVLSHDFGQICWGVYSQSQAEAAVTHKIRNGPNLSMVMKLSSYKMQKFLFFFLVKRHFLKLFFKF